MYLEKLRLDGKVALVAGGAGGGNGTATSMALAEAGARVVVLDVSAEQAQETAQHIRSLNGVALPLTADVTDDRQMENAVKATLQEFGRIDILANVAGGMRGRVPTAGIIDFPVDGWETVFRVNLRYVFVLGRLVAKHLIEQKRGGSIVNILSIEGVRSSPNACAYGAAKAGLGHLTRTMAVEWGSHGIRVNAVSPGGVATPRVMRLANRTLEQQNARYKGVAPLQRSAYPEEVAAAVLFLASDLASYITGHTLHVEGGLLARNPIPWGNP